MLCCFLHGDSIRLLGVTKISAQKSYCFVTHPGRSTVPKIIKKKPHCWDLNKSIALKSCTFSPIYGGAVNGVADSLHGRHLLVDAVGALYSTCRRALASPEDSIERATARSALARRARGWGCSVAPTSWLGSAEHLATAVEMEKAMEAKGGQMEATSSVRRSYAVVEEDLY